MNKEKRRVSIIIENLDDTHNVLIALDNLFKTIIEYYIDKENLNSLAQFILTCSVYFGGLLTTLGYNDNKFEGK